ncbi:hypothetical protein AKJ16_DCAP11648 [Drosera capensis]
MHRITYYEDEQPGTLIWLTLFKADMSNESPNPSRLLGANSWNRTGQNEPPPPPCLHRRHHSDGVHTILVMISLCLKRFIQSFKESGLSLAVEGFVEGCPYVEGMALQDYFVLELNRYSQRNLIALNPVVFDL